MQVGIRDHRLLQRWNVIRREFDPAVKCEHVICIDLDPAGMSAPRNSRDFLLILFADFIPEQFVSRIAEEFPIVICGSRQILTEDRQRFIDFFRQQVSVLIAEILGGLGPSMISFRSRGPDHRFGGGAENPK